MANFIGLGGLADKFGISIQLVTQQDSFANFDQGCPRELRFWPGIAKFIGIDGWAEKFRNFTWLLTKKDNFPNFGYCSP